jgi:hypothetical protein
MDTDNEIIRALGRIEGELVEIRKLSERVSKLEQWQSWLRWMGCPGGGLRLPLQRSVWKIDLCVGFTRHPS